MDEQMMRYIMVQYLGDGQVLEAAQHEVGPERRGYVRAQPQAGQPPRQLLEGEPPFQLRQRSADAVVE
jgi:hypothetical protein